MRAAVGVHCGVPCLQLGSTHLCCDTVCLLLIPQWRFFCRVQVAAFDSAFKDDLPELAAQLGAGSVPAVTLVNVAVGEPTGRPFSAC